jgi:hypothetical protein
MFVNCMYIISYFRQKYVTAKVHTTQYTHKHTPHIYFRFRNGFCSYIPKYSEYEEKIKTKVADYNKVTLLCTILNNFRGTKAYLNFSFV